MWQLKHTDIAILHVATLHPAPDTRLPIAAETSGSKRDNLYEN